MKQIIKQLGERGELVIPKKIREDLGMKPDTEIVLQVFDFGIFLFSKKKSLQKMVGLFKPKHKIDMREVDLIAEYLLAGLDEPT